MTTRRKWSSYFKGPVYRRSCWPFFATGDQFHPWHIRLMRDSSRRIKYQTFVRYADRDDLRLIAAELGYSAERPIHHSLSATYWRGIFFGWEVVYFVHSGTEFIFTSRTAASHIGKMLRT